MNIAFSLLGLMLISSDYNDASSEAGIYERTPYEQPYWGNNKMTRRGYDDLGSVTTDSSLVDIIKVIGRAIIIALRITASQIVKGTANVINNLGNHDNGMINVPAATKIGHAAGRTVNTFMREFLKSRWNGLLSHIAQEATDRFVEGSQEFMARLTGA